MLFIKALWGINKGITIRSVLDLVGYGAVGYTIRYTTGTLATAIADAHAAAVKIDRERAGGELGG